MRSEQVESAADSKAALRGRFRHYRGSLTQDGYERLSASIIEQAKLLPELKEAKTVHVYWPMVQQREVDTRPLIRWLETSGKNIVLPKVVSFRRKRGKAMRITQIRYPGERELIVNQWGILEPPPGNSVSPEELDAIVLPALGAGRNGHRIGHGLGYYDELLAELQIPKIGLVYARCLVDFVPPDPHDEPLDILISEDEVLRVRPM